MHRLLPEDMPYFLDRVDLFGLVDGLRYVATRLVSDFMGQYSRQFFLFLPREKAPAMHSRHLEFFTIRDRSGLPLDAVLHSFNNIRHLLLGDESVEGSLIDQFGHAGMHG